MQTLQLLEGLEFHEDRPLATPLLVAASGRVLRFTLKPGQHIREHCAPHSPVHIIVLSGRGMFGGEDGRDVLLERDALVVFEAGELHRVRALEQELVFVALLHKVEHTAEEAQARNHANPRESDTYLTWHM